MGIVLAIGLLVSAAIDLVVARGMGARLSGASAAAQLQFGGSILCALAFVAVFLGFWMPDDLRFGYAIVTGILFRIAYALYDLPQNALMALATQDASARDRVASTRIWFSGIATLTVASAVGPLISGRDADGAALYVGLAIATAAPAVLGAWLLARVIRPAGSAVHQSVRRDPRTSSGRPTQVFLLLIALMFVTSLATPLFSKIEPFFAVYALRSPLWGGVIVIAMALGITLGQPLWAMLCARLPRAVVMGGSALVQIVALASFWALAPGAPQSLTVAAFLFGLGNGGVGMVLWGAFSDVVAHHARGQEGMAYGAFTATAKTALALGGFGLGAALESFDYRDAGSDGLLVLMTLIPAVGALACVVIAGGWVLAAKRRPREGASR